MHMQQYIMSLKDKHPGVQAEVKIMRAAVRILQSRPYSMYYTTSELVASIGFKDKYLVRLVLDYHTDPRNQEAKLDEASPDGRSIRVAARNGTWQAIPPSSTDSLRPFSKYGYKRIRFEQLKWFSE